MSKNPRNLLPDTWKDWLGKHEQTVGRLATVLVFVIALLGGNDRLNDQDRRIETHSIRLDTQDTRLDNHSGRIRTLRQVEGDFLDFIEKVLQTLRDDPRNPRR